MLNPFRQLLKRLIESPGVARDTPQAAPDSPEDGAPISAPIAFENAGPSSEPVDRVSPVSTEFVARPNVAAPPFLETPGLAGRTSDPRSEPLPTEIPWNESARLDDSALEMGDVVEREAHTFSVPADDARWSEAGIHSDVYYIPREPVEPLKYNVDPMPPPCPCAPRPRLVDDRPNPPSFARPDEPTGDEIPVGSARAAFPHTDPALAARIRQALDLFEKTRPAEDPVRMLTRFESMLQRFVTSQQDLSRFAERLDQLETAHFLRGRL